MSTISETSALAPFRVRSFRFQWPADMATSWAFEMESLILGWYILVETKSVLMLAVFASLQFTGTLIGPMVGVMGDRIGHRNLLCIMRAIYALLAATLMILTFAGVLTPVHVFVIAALSGLVRPSDIGTRAAVVGDTMPGAQLMDQTGHVLRLRLPTDAVPALTATVVEVRATLRELSQRRESLEELFVQKAVHMVSSDGQRTPAAGGTP